MADWLHTLRAVRRHILLAAGLGSTALLSACFGGGGSTGFAGNVPGTGKAVLNLERVEWGRLVDVFDADGLQIERDVVVREGLVSDGINYLLDLNPVTGDETLTILRPQADPAFAALLSSARTGLSSVAKKGLSDPPTFSRIARNGSLRLEFSELLDPASVNRQTIQLLVGDPPSTTQDVRYVVKETVGADGKPKGVIVVDPTISKFDTADSGIPENPVGYPASFDQTAANLLLRIPTTLDPLFGVTQILTNKAGNRGLTPTNSDPTELSPGLDLLVVRAMRTGNELDPFNGFTVDLQRPKLITNQPVEISQVVESGSLRIVTYSISVVNCRNIRPKVGDILETGDAVLLVSRVDSDIDPLNFQVTAALVEGELAGGVFGGSPLLGELTTAYGSLDGPLQLCWLEFSPEPSTLPATGVDPYASITVHFNEPMDQATVRSLETMVLCSFEIDPNPSGNDPTRQFRGVTNGTPSSESVGEYIDRQIGFDKIGTGGRILFGPIEVSADSRDFTLSPSAGMADSNADGSLNLCLALRDGSDGILDLAGNPVDFNAFVAGNSDQSLSILLAGAPSTWPRDRYFALRMNSLDEDSDGLSEYNGQFSFENGLLRGRPLVRFSRLADSSNPFIGQRNQFGLPIQTPLTPPGAVLMTVFRYIDLGFGLQAPNEYNLDVEQMHWSPFGGRVFDDIFDRWSLALAHSNRFPDEFISPTTGYPVNPQSGLRRGAEFDDNILGFPDFDETIVFDVPTYPLSQVNMFNATSGSAMYPWPEFTATYTWRDTAIPQSYQGAPLGSGVPPLVVGAPPPPVYRSGRVPSIGLPLLARFRSYPRGEFTRQNGFQIQIMVASSSLPAFRVFSAGGRDSGGTWHIVVPDDPGSGGTRPRGGFQPNGNSTNVHGPELYWHQVDFVLRVSRVFTHWFSLGGTPQLISGLSVEPTPEVQPPGTQVVVEFRGSGDVNEAGCSTGEPTPLTDASEPFDDYGDFAPPACGTVNTVSNWTTDVQSLVTAGHQFFQIRITFLSNIEQNLQPELDAFGFAWNVF